MYSSFSLNLFNSYLLLFSLRYIQRLLVKAVGPLATLVNDLDNQTHRKMVVDVLALVGQSACKLNLTRRRALANEINPQYRKLAYDRSDVTGPNLFDDLSKCMKDAFVMGKLSKSVRQSKNWQSYPAGKRKRQFTFKGKLNKRPYQSNQQ